MDKNKLKILLQKFESYSEFYDKKYLSKINKEKLLTDSDYARWIFIYFWALERQGAPYGYKVAALKSLSYKRPYLEFKNLYGTNDSIKDEFAGLNLSRNPFMQHTEEGKCNCIYCFKIPDIIKNINSGNLEKANKELKKIKGLGDKIVYFFMRDIIHLTNSEKNFEWDLNKYRFIMPIDSWLYTFCVNLDEIKNSSLVNARSKIDPLNDIDRDTKKSEKIRIYDETEKNKKDESKKLIEHCMNFHISPIKLNMGIWAYCSRVIGSKSRLEMLIYNYNNGAEINIFDKELNLLNAENFGINIFS